MSRYHRHHRPAQHTPSDSRRELTRLYGQMLTAGASYDEATAAAFGDHRAATTPAPDPVRCPACEHVSLTQNPLFHCAYCGDRKRITPAERDAYLQAGEQSPAFAFGPVLIGAEVV